MTINLNALAEIEKSNLTKSPAEKVCTCYVCHPELYLSEKEVAILRESYGDTAEDRAMAEWSAGGYEE